jgi:A/G-specific adenine glycosylase
MHFADTLIDWHARHGRHDLPWQQQRTAYRVWVSEIMLQQTQVATVIPYYQRFMQRFPDVAALAAAPTDEVLYLWSGLGYYSRARNLHRAAQRVMSEYEGVFPAETETLQELPGVGRSTAAAIAALAFDRRATILDGNVKRVLARYFAIEGSPTERSVEQQLWRQAEQCTPHSKVAVYTQAIMDFGATLCTRSRPLCVHCPLQPGCAAFAQGRALELPMPRRRPARPTREVVMLLVVNPSGRILLQRRPPRGIWGGLWTPPEFTDQASAARFCEQTLSASPMVGQAMPPVHHAFTHFDLTIMPLQVRCPGPVAMEAGDALWYNARDPAPIGLPSPIATLLSQV